MAHKLRWYQFTLRSLLLLVVFASLVFSWLSVQIYSYEREHQVAINLQYSKGFHIQYDTSGGGAVRRLLSRVLGKDYSPVIGLSNDTDRLILSNRTINEDDFAPIQHLLHLRTLDLGISIFSTEETLEPVGKLSELEEIRLYGNSVSGAVFQRWGRLAKLKRLELFRTSVDDKALDYLGNIPSLQELFLMGGHVTDNGLKHLCRLPSLDVLVLSDLPITEQGILNLKGSKTLRYLNISNLHVNQHAINELQKALPDLYIKYEPQKECD